MFLLSGAVAYNALLSIVPFFALILLNLSLFLDEETLLDMLKRGVELAVPGQSQVIVDQIRGLLAVSEVGWVAIVLLVFFSAQAFLVLEGALERIFEHRSMFNRRHLLVSVVIPYLYMLVLGLVMIGFTLTTGVLAGLEHRIPESIAEVLETTGLRFGGFVLEFMLFTSFYMVMPAGRIAFRHAAVGGLAAATLWEIVRRIFGWYFATVSPVNLVYGSLGAVIVSLLLLEMGAVIILMGAQVIAEYERFVYREHYSTTRRVRTGMR